MRRAVFVVVAAVAVVAAIVLVTGGVGDDSHSSEDTAERLQHEFIGAQACMTVGERRRLRRTQDRTEALLDDLANRLPPDASEDAKSKLITDPRVVRLIQEGNDLMEPYLPGGSRYDQRCYDRAWDRFKRRLARQE